MTVDPAPDLVVEIDLSNARMDKREIYAAMGVAEIWRHDGTNLTAWVLVDGSYVPTAFSRACPTLPIADLERHLALALSQGQHAARIAWRRWLIEHSPISVNSANIRAVLGAHRSR